MHIVLVTSTGNRFAISDTDGAYRLPMSAKCLRNEEVATGPRLILRYLECLSPGFSGAGVSGQLSALGGFPVAGVCWADPAHDQSALRKSVLDRSSELGPPFRASGRVLSLLSPRPLGTVKPRIRVWCTTAQRQRRWSRWKV